MQRQSGFKLSPFDIKRELVDSTHNQCLMDQNVRNDHAATWTSIAAHAHMIHVHFATGRPSTIIVFLEAGSRDTMVRSALITTKGPLYGRHAEERWQQLVHQPCSPEWRCRLLQPA